MTPPGANQTVPESADLKDRLEALRRELIAWLEAGEQLDAGVMRMLADVRGCLDAVADFKMETGQ